MATIYTLHPDNPQTRKVEQIREALQRGAVMLYPTDTVYAIGCDLNSKAAIERVRLIKRLSNEKPLTFLCPSLSNIASYAYVTDSSYRLVRHLVPGPYTFLLPATKLVPRLVMSPKRKTTGIRVPDHAICQALLQSLGNPVISSSAPVPSEMEHHHVSKPELFDFLSGLVDIVIDDEDPLLRHDVSTVLDLTAEEPTVLRRGLGWEAVNDLPLALEIK
jgi:tRNA threonylcarbamoyl adenosine modification protein (Sua5/YciO/YrdC/YwlC family)